MQHKGEKMDYFKKYCDSPDFIDLRNLADDRTVLENPHKGWYHHYIDNGMWRKAYRDDIAEGDYLEYVPGLRQLYLRIDWIDIEKEEGKCDWSYIDDVMTRWGERGYTFSFRFCTYEGAGREIPVATPEWVFEKGAKKTYVTSHSSVLPPESVKPDSLYEPDYDDDIFLYYVDRWIAECARKFDGNPLVEYVDIGTFGTWGEGHTGYGSGIDYPFSCLQKHIDLHLKHFRQTQLFLMYGYIVVALGAGMEGVDEFIEYNRNRGLGLRCDSVSVEGYYESYGYDTLQTPDLFGIFGENCPINLENGHQRYTSPEAFRDGLTLVEAARTAHATYAGFHGYISEWWPKYRYIHEYLANRLGYWYFLPGAELEKTARAADGIRCVLHIENKGFARAYHRFDPVCMLIDRDGNRYFLPCEAEDNRLWEPGEKRPVLLRADPTNASPAIPQKLLAGENGEDGLTQEPVFTLCFGLREKERTIRFAVRQECCVDGLVPLGEVKFVP